MNLDFYDSVIHILSHSVLMNLALCKHPLLNEFDSKNNETHNSVFR